MDEKRLDVRKMITVLNNMDIQLMSSSRFHRLLSFGIVLLIIFVGVSTLFGFAHLNKGASAAGSSFSFTAAGDYSNTSATIANLHLMASSGANFNLAIGDLNYDPTLTADAWSAYVKSHLPANFPFEIVAGNEDPANINTFITDLPDHLGGISGTYGEEYTFDYPSSAPLARFIMISPGGILPGYSYSIGSPHYNWVAQEINGARSAGIPWVIVGMHEFCIAMGTIPCTIGSDLENLLISEKVDLVLQAHTHDYQVTKQLALNSTTCPNIVPGSYNPACVVNATTHMSKGAGTVFVMTGTGGTMPLFTLSTSDPETGYMRTWMAFNNNQTWGLSHFTVSPTQISMKFMPTSGGNFTDSFTITNTNPNATPTVSPSSTSTSSPGQTPVNTLWYFAEGRVGGGFKEYLTLGNPTGNDCQVNIRYLYTPDGGTSQTKTVAVDVPAHQRVTQSVNADLNVLYTQRPGSSDSATVSVNTTSTPNCAGIVAERPMYFNALGVNSNSDVIGATHTGTTFYFADVATGNQPTGGYYSSYITVLNPGTAAATVTATYYAAGHQVGTQQTAVPGGTRGTISANSTPNLPPHVAVVVTSTQPVVVERPTYFSNITAGNAQTVSGAADVVGVQNPAKEFLFAEGYTGGQFQENLVLANFGSSSTSTNVVLEFANGHTQTVPLTIGPQSQSTLDVNHAVATHTGTCDVNPCQSTPEVSMDVQAAAPIVAERELFFHYSHTSSIGRTLVAMGGTDVIGQVGPAAVTTYSFAEGYTNVGYDEWLTLQNPTTQSETITVTLLNGLGTTYTLTINMAAQSRSTVDITATVVQNVVHTSGSTPAYEVSMAVQSSGGPFVAERPMYSNTGPAGTQGGTDVIGYTGG
jgi:hypothetical protein